MHGRVSSGFSGLDHVRPDVLGLLVEVLVRDLRIFRQLSDVGSGDATGTVLFNGVGEKELPGRLGFLLAPNRETVSRGDRRCSKWSTRGDPPSEPARVCSEREVQANFLERDSIGSVRAKGSKIRRQVRTGKGREQPFSWNGGDRLDSSRSIGRQGREALGPDRPGPSCRQLESNGARSRFERGVKVWRRLGGG